MDIKDIVKFADEIQDVLAKYYNKSKEDMLLFHALKVGEETGELFEQVLGHYNIQRKDKILDKEKIGSEIADVILSATILGRSLNLDIEKELIEKIETNKERLK